VEWLPPHALDRCFADRCVSNRFKALRLVLHKRRYALAWGPAIVALIVATVAYNGIRRAGELGAAAQESAEISDALSAVMLGLVDAETGQRGFVLTGDSTYLAPYERGRQVVPAALATVAGLLRSNRNDEQTADTLRTLATAKLAELAATVRLRATAGRAAAIEEVANGRGKSLMDSSRQMADRLGSHENAKLVQLSARQARQRAVARLVLFIGIATTVLLGLWANARLIREAETLALTVRERDAANATLQDQAVELEIANQELTTLANSLQEQAIELEQQSEEAQTLAEELEVTNDELARANDDLEERSRIAAAAEEKAHSASKAKSDFLAMMSHEIRTPINAVVGYSELLALGLSGPLSAEQSAQVDRIQKSTQHLLQLVNEILDLAKIESGTLRVDAGHGQVGKTVDAAMDLVRTQADAKNIVLSDRCDGTRGVSYRGDQDRVCQIMLNLLSNAVKFTHAGGTITVDARVTIWPDGHHGSTNPMEPCVALTVSDSGIGIAGEHFVRIFEPFTQIETDGRNPYTREQSGTGLGLPISRQLAGLMGGDLTVESDVGSGSRFTLWLPASPSAERIVAPEPAMESGA
jgi:signal transduction histidine kinase